MSTRGLCLQGYRSWGLKLTTHLHLVPRLTVVEPYLQSPIRLHVIVLEYIVKYRDNLTFTFTPQRFAVFLNLIMKIKVQLVLPILHLQNIIIPYAMGTYHDRVLQVGLI
jgi:hypothetical protein